MPVNTLTASPLAVGVPGTFPASTQYPGPNVYPGKGSTLAAAADTVITLTGTPN